MPSLLQLNISPGGIPKRPVLFARVTSAGVEGDRQKNLKYHGGANRAICLFSEELYAQLRSEGIDVHPGDFGENFATRGIDLLSLTPGDRLQVGECLIEITKVRVPCRQLNVFADNLHRKIEGRSGWMARVIVEGLVRPGDEIAIKPRASPPCLSE